MIKTTTMLLEELKDYHYPAHKLARMVKHGDIFQVIRGLYVTDKNIPGHSLAASIYGPSYLSFDFALSYWQLIPEAVFVYSSATYDKKKTKQFKTDFGVFTYRDVPKAAYPAGVKIMQDGVYSFLIAEPEKALCDKLYTLSPTANMQDLENLFWNDLRIDRVSFQSLSSEKLIQYAALYKTKNHKLLIRYLRRNA